MGLATADIFPIYGQTNLFFQVIGIVIAAIAIAGIPQGQEPYIQHMFIVILVLVVFMGAVSLANCFISKG